MDPVWSLELLKQKRKAGRMDQEERSGRFKVWPGSDQLFISGFEVGAKEWRQSLESPAGRQQGDGILSPTTTWNPILPTTWKDRFFPPEPPDKSLASAPLDLAWWDLKPSPLGFWLTSLWDNKLMLAQVTKFVVICYHHSRSKHSPSLSSLHLQLVFSSLLIATETIMMTMVSVIFCC